MKTANRIEKRRLPSRRGLETIVDWVAIVFVVIGVIVALSYFFIFCFLGSVVWGLINAVTVLFAAFLSWLVFRCLAEHLRLQKKIAGCRFDGAITGQEEEIIWACSDCGQVLYANDRCESCGAEIKPDQP